jgi:uncharacterized protein
MTKHEHIDLHVEGMTCRSCEILVERRLSKVKGVKKAHANYNSGLAHIEAEAGTDRTALERAIEDAGYSITENHSAARIPWKEIGVSVVLAGAILLVFRSFDFLSLAPAQAAGVGLGAAFVLGLIASVSSCLAVTGGLLLTMSATYREWTSSQTQWQRFRPLLQFNIGRIGSYILLGGVIGALGNSLMLGTQATGLLNILVAVAMIYMALGLLGITPMIRPPKRIAHHIATLSESKHPVAPFLLGAGTFFLPCGFTQSLQLAALASGGFLEGAMLLGAFALGTLPALLGLSMISSLSNRSFSRHFMRFAGALALLLGLWNIQSGFTLLGIDPLLSFQERQPSQQQQAAFDPAVTMSSDGRQIISMKVTSYGYEPSSFTIKPGIETWVYVTGEAVSGCTSILTAPDFGLTTPVRTHESTWLGPITNPQKDFLLTCSMGMVRANVDVQG